MISKVFREHGNVRELTVDRPPTGMLDIDMITVKFTGDPKSYKGSELKEGKLRTDLELLIMWEATVPPAA